MFKEVEEQKSKAIKYSLRQHCFFFFKKKKITNVPTANKLNPGLINLRLNRLVKIFPTNNFEKALEHYNNCIKTAIDKHAPKKAKKIKNVPSCPWFDHKYVQLRRKRRKAV